MTSASKKYVFEFGGAMVLYTISILAMPAIVGAIDEGSGWLWGVALIPIIPTSLSILAMVRFYRRQDEMQQRVMGEAHFIGAMVTIFVTFAYGFLEIHVQAPPLPTIIVLPMFFAMMGVALPFVVRRYR